MVKNMEATRVGADVCPGPLLCVRLAWALTWWWESATGEAALVC